MRFLRVAALHELGHAIVAAELGHAVDRISIISGVDTGGTASTRLVTLFPTLAQVRSAHSIRARGVEWPHHEAGHTTAPDHMPKANEKPLASRWAPTHDWHAEQLPADPVGQDIVEAVHGFFADDPHGFEVCAAELARMMLRDIASLDLTRRSRDGGRDGIGKLRIGVGASAILVDFALEAKCYAPTHAVGVREMSRLISRLRHRQFGILVTTSCVDEQAYKEIKEDEHPILVIAASDIVGLLKQTGYGTVGAVQSWLERSFPSSL